MLNDKLKATQWIIQRATHAKQQVPSTSTTHAQISAIIGTINSNHSLTIRSHAITILSDIMNIMKRDFKIVKKNQQIAADEQS